MATLTYKSYEYEVDHVVKGANYIHGYDANGKLTVSFEGVTDFSEFEYTGTFLEPDSCISESCNDVKVVDSVLKTADGRDIPPEAIEAGSLKDSNSGSAVKLWLGTQFEYAQLPEEEKKDKLIIITNDTFRDTITSHVNELETWLEDLESGKRDVYSAQYATEAQTAKLAVEAERALDADWADGAGRAKMLYLNASNDGKSLQVREAGIYFIFYQAGALRCCTSLFISDVDISGGGGTYADGQCQLASGYIYPRTDGISLMYAFYFPV